MFRHFVEKNCKKSVATLTQVVPDDQSRNDQKKHGQGRLTKKKLDYRFLYIYIHGCVRACTCI